MAGKMSPRERAALATQMMNSSVAPSPSFKSDSESPVRPANSVQIGLSMAGQGAKVIELERKLKEAETTVDVVRADLCAVNAEWEGALPAKKLDPKSIKASKYANRHVKSFDGTDFAELKAEIESAGGNVQAIKVRPIPGSVPQEYEVVFGHRRHRACLELGISVLATIESIDDKELFKEMDRENRQRADLRPYEQGVMYLRALDEGLFSSQRKLAEELGVDVGGVGKLVTLARLPADVLNAFESPLDIQFAWGPLLASALQKDVDAVLSRAREFAKLDKRPKASTVFHMLTATGVDSIYPLETKPVELSGKAGSKAKVSYDTKKKQIGVSIVGVSAARISELEQVIKKILG